MVQHGSIGGDELGERAGTVDDELSQDDVVRAGERVMDVEDLAGHSQGGLQDGELAENSSRYLRPSIPPSGVAARYRQLLLFQS